MEGVKKTMEKALAEFLKVAQREPLWVHEDQAGRSQIVSTFISGFAQGGVRVTESSRSREILDFDVSDIFRVVSDEWESAFAGIARIEAKFVALTPKIPARTVSLFRFCKRFEEEEERLLVALVEVSDPRLQRGDFNRLPSGVLLERLGTGSTRVTWVEHCEVDEGLLGIATEDPNLGAFASHRWLAVLKEKLIQSQREVQGCAFSSRFITNDLNWLEDAFTIQTMVKKMVGEVISPTIGEGWSQIPSRHGLQYFRFIHKEKKCVMIHSGWLEREANAICQSFQDQRDAWDPSVNDTLEVETDYGDGACLLRRRCGYSGKLKHLILQHLSPLSRMMFFSRLDRHHPFDLLTEGFAIVPCKNNSLVTTVLVHELPDGVDLTLTSDQMSVCEHLINKCLTLYNLST